MSKNKDNSGSSENISAQDLLKRLSSQYDADTDKKPGADDTFEGIPVDSGDDRLSTAEFKEIFDVKDTEQFEVTEDLPIFTDTTEEKAAEPEMPEEIPAEEPVEEEPVEEEAVAEEPAEEGPVEEEQTLDIPEETETEPDDETVTDMPSYNESLEIPVEFELEVTSEYALAFDDTYTGVPAEEPVEEEPVQEPEPEPEQAAEQEEEKPVTFNFSDTLTTEPATGETASIDNDTSVFANRMAGEETLESFKPLEEMNKEETEVIKEASHANKEETAEIEDTDEVSETAMMKAFGLDPRKVVEKDDSKKIFDTYTFASTDEMDSVSDDTDTTEISEEGEENKESEEVAYEYTDPSQKKDILTSFREKYTSAKIRMGANILFALMLFVVECLPAFIGEEFIFGTNIFIKLIVDAGLMLVCAILVFSSMIKAVILLTKSKMNGNAITLFSFLISLIISIVSIVMCNTSGGMSYIPLCNFPFTICTFFSILSEFLSLRRDVYNFKIVSSSEKKSVLAKVNRIERYPEEKEFGEYMGDYSDVYRVEETDFVSDFFKKRKEISSANKALLIMVPSSILLAIVVAVIFGATAPSFDINSTVAIGNMAYWFVTPIVAFMSLVYPQYLAAIRAYSNKSAIIGDTTPEDTQRIAAVTFTDFDAFPPERIKIKSVKVFENYHIENVIYFASSVFSKIGGPLSVVFKQATLDSINSENVEIKEVTDLGIDAFVDGRHIVVGQPAYMESQCFETMYEPGDEEFEGQTNKRILYLARDEVVVAKFYIQYNVSSDFLYIVRHLTAEGMCISIRSSDPCIDNDVLYKNKIDPTEVPVRVIKGQGTIEKKESVSTKVGSIVSTGSKKGLIKTLLLCDRITNIRKTNLVVKILSMIIGLVIAVLLVTTGAGLIPSAWPALFQLFWLIPILLVAKIYI